MKELLTKISLFFATKLSFSKLKVYITIPLAIYYIISFSIEIKINLTEFTFKMTDGADSFNNLFLYLLIFLIILLWLDMISNKFDSDKNERSEQRAKEVLENDKLPNALKRKWLDRL